MATSKKTALKDLSLEELSQRIQESKLNFQKSKFNHAVSPLENPLMIRTQRREIARMLTELNRRQSSQQ